MPFYLKHACWVAISIAINLQFCMGASAAKRVALVIGNSAYQHASTLANPRHDAADMAEALRKRDFEVIEGLDLDKADFDGKIRDFSDALNNAEMGMFYYAGHGLQVAGQNYLVPIDAKLSSAASLDFEMIRLDLVQRTMERATRTNVIFLDACRNNPLARNLAQAMGTRSVEIGRGLALVEAGVGTLISFSTNPGNVALDGTGRNSPYAKALIRQIASSGEDLSRLLIAVRNDVMRDTQGRQVPWEHSALTALLFFDSRRDPTPPDATPPKFVWKFSSPATPPKSEAPAAPYVFKARPTATPSTSEAPAAPYVFKFRPTATPSTSTAPAAPPAVKSSDSK